MSRTYRNGFKGQMRDGQHVHRCPEKHCDWCVSKPPMKERDDIKEQRE